eukprot:343966-Prymnesium_polylepis.1
MMTSSTKIAERRRTAREISRHTVFMDADTLGLRPVCTHSAKAVTKVMGVDTPPERWPEP